MPVRSVPIMLPLTVTAAMFWLKIAPLWLGLAWRTQSIPLMAEQAAQQMGAVVDPSFHVDAADQIDEDTANVLFVGRHEPRKGLLDLLKAHRILRRAGYENRLLVVGSGRGSGHGHHDPHS